MNKYELAVVLSSKLEEEERAAAIEKVQGYITRYNWLMRFRSLKRLTITSSSLMVMQSVQVKLRDTSALWNRLSDIFALSRKRKQGAQASGLSILERAWLLTMNKVILMGRLTRDPEVRYSQGERQMAIARYTLAVDRRGRANTSNGEQTADFIQCVAFDRSAEFAEKYFHQGTKLVVTGRIQTGSYTNKDGQKVYTTDVIVEDQEFAESKSASAGSDNGGYRPAMSQSRPEPASAVASGFMNIPDGVEDEGLPFN